MEKEAINEQTFESIMNEYGEELKRFILTYVKDPTVTDDLIQDVFLKVYLKFDRFEDRSAPRTWLYRIAINRCKDYFRSWHYQKVKVMQTFDLLQGKWERTPEDRVLKKSKDNELAREILSLSPKYREVILLYYYRDFNVEETASLLGLKRSTVRTRMQRARAQLREKLGGEYLEP
ncbi:MAG TPA: sigma-70 family RNA polymerase sigma factor [Bacillales bacterium]|nr:sigma-70 family RNA polymerase sigma factor [Bacillales bacterium]